MINHTKYDFIIAGAGCAGLSLLMRMLKNSTLSGKRILLIDRDKIKTNDRTWCFWEEKPGFFDHLVYRQWSQLDFFGETYEETLSISPYQYKMIRSIDFYNYCFSEINKYPNVDQLYGDLTDIRHANGRVLIRVSEEQLDASDAIVFSSIAAPPYKSEKKELTVLQHFKGWVIETHQPVFDPNRATLMDFRIPQEYGTSFVYVLPFNSTSALVEYTLFTKELLSQDQYDEGLKTYLHNQLSVAEYRVLEQEFGIIPMTNRKFKFYSNGLYYIGAAGGQTKASTGYTFQFIQKQSDEIINALESGSALASIPSSPLRFRFYDNTLLHILYHNTYPGKKIFSTLFQKNDPIRILRFLDNESSLWAELGIISSLPSWPFLKAALKSF